MPTGECETQMKWHSFKTLTNLLSFMIYMESYRISDIEHKKLLIETLTNFLKYKTCYMPTGECETQMKWHSFKTLTNLLSFMIYMESYRISDIEHKKLLIETLTNFLVSVIITGCIQYDILLQNKCGTKTKWHKCNTLTNLDDLKWFHPH